MKAKIKKILQFIANPRLLLCIAVAWMITNGWSYVLFSLGIFLDINWMTVVGGAYMALLWFPFTPEKIITAAIAIALLRLWFPNDEKTLAVLREFRQKAKEGKLERKAAKEEKKRKKQQEKAHDKSNHN